MSLTKRNLLMVLAAFLTCLALISASMPKATAALPYGFYSYFSDCAHTQLVGEQVVNCDGSSGGYWGDLNAPFVEFEPFDCSGGGGALP